MKTRLLLLLPLGLLLTGLCVYALFSLFNREPLEAGTPAPAFALDNLSGETVSFSDLEDKLILLHFWSAA